MKTQTKIFLIMTGIILAVALMQVASALTISSVSSSPAEVQPGEKARIDMTIENNLGDDVENVVISLDLTNLPFAPYQSSNERTIEDINDGNDEDVEFELIAFADAASGTYKIPVEMSYNFQDETAREKTKGTISLIINAKPEIGVSSDEGNILIKGKDNTLIVKIINSGLGEAKFLSVQILPVSGIKIIGSDKVYIGNIDSDDFDTAEFKIVVNADAGTINLPVSVAYKDSRNKDFTDVENIALKSYTTKEAISLGLIKANNSFIYIIIVIVIIILVLIFRAIRKRRRNKQKEKE